MLQLDEYSNQLAHFLLSAGFKHGDSVALFMENRLEYVGLWLGCTKIGVVPALINFNLRGKSLMHSIAAVSASAVIFGSELASGERMFWPVVLAVLILPPQPSMTSSQSLLWTSGCSPVGRNSPRLAEPRTWRA